MKLCRWWSVQETFIQAHHLLSHLWLWRLEPNCTDRAARAELWSVQLIGPDIENSRWWIKSGIRTRRYRALWPSQKVSSGRRAYNVGIPVRAKIWAADSGLGLGLCLKGRGETVGTELKGLWTSWVSVKAWVQAWTQLLNAETKRGLGLKVKSNFPPCENMINSWIAVFCGKSKSWVRILLL